jgi:sigma-B regulation protein RsbU (phosphoserine phosphatase)
VRFAWGFRPCDELAGDLLGIVPLDDDRVGLYVIDVAGHGVPAALLSVTLSHWLAPARGQSPLMVSAPDDSRGEVSPPARVAERLSAQFPFDVRTAQYFTMLYGVLDMSRRTFRFVCAGHPAPVHQPRREPAFFLSASGFPVGIVPEAEYEETEIALDPGDRLFLFSDGLADAQNASGQEFGRQALLEALAGARSEPLDAAVQSTLTAIESHVGDSGMKDDLTLLGVEAL